MKNKALVLISIFAISIVVCSCGQNSSSSDAQVAELQKQLADLQQQVNNQQVQNNQGIQQTQSNQNSIQQNQVQQNNQQGQFSSQPVQQFGNTNVNVTMDQAKQIATSNAGFEVNSVTFVKTIQDYDDGFVKWEIDFVANNMKYEYDISATDGTILKSEREGVAYQGGVQQGFGNQQNFAGQGQGIDVEQAKSIATQHAGFNATGVTFTKQKYDFDDGMSKWEIEFVVNTNKYEYDISAINGTVLKYKVESIYND